MKSSYSKLFLLILLLFTTPILFAQQGDTSISYKDYYDKPAQGYDVHYIRLQWKADKLWFVQDVYWPEKTVKMTGSYSDSAGRKKQGLFRNFYKNGIEDDSCNYINNKRHGLSKGWYEDGSQSSIKHYNMGIKVDTCIIWNKEGNISTVYIADSTGTGMEQLYNISGKIKASGRYFNGKKDGLWVYKDNEGILSQEVTYAADSALVINCFDENGNADTKNKCVLEQVADFAGGTNGWRRYLERNLRYPDESQRARVQGQVIVKFIVDTSGKVSDISIINTPDKYLGAEALRIIKFSPNWETAIQYNRKVSYNMIQKITFQLQ